MFEPPHKPSSPQPPSIQHPLLRALDEARALVSSSPPPSSPSSLALFEAPDHQAQLTFSTTHERAVIALSMLLLEQLLPPADLPEKLPERILQKLWSMLSKQERVEIEIEAFHILEHLATAIAPSLQATRRPIPSQVSPDSSHHDIARWAIHHGRDLALEMYDPQRGQLIRHVITPMSLDAAIYLRAVSHTTREEIVFSLKSIGTLAPAQGWTMHHHEGPGARSSFDEVSAEELDALDQRTPHDARTHSPQQMSWLDELPAPPEEDDDDEDR